MKPEDAPLNWQDASLDESEADDVTISVHPADLDDLGIFTWPGIPPPTPPMFDAASLASPAVTINSDGSLTLHGDCQEEFSSLFQYDIGPWAEIDNTHLVIGQYENLADEMHWTHWSRSMMPPPPGQVLVREPSQDAMDEMLDIFGLLEPENTQPVASSSYLAPPPRPPPIRHASLTNIILESMDALELEDVEEEESSMEMEDVDMDSELEPDDAASSSSLDKGKGKERARD